MSDSDDYNSKKSKVVAFRKVGKLRPTASRKRENSDSDGGRGGNESGGSDEDARIVRLPKLKRPNPMVQSTSSKRAVRKPANDESDDSEAEERNKLLGSEYKSSKDSVLPKDMGATATMEQETDFKVDAQAQFERNQKIIKENRGKADDKIYRGMGAYGQFKEKKDSAAGNASSGLVRKGPIRAPTNVRMSVRWDYQPDLCKDYKETGFCGFGDSCKFLHDRTDYKHGWELERDWEQGRYGKDDADPHQFEISDHEDELPFKCLICRNSFTNPVVTKCKHYFCEKCALAHFRKSQKCYACEKNTGGVFNPAKEIIARLKGEESKSKRRGEEDEDKFSSASDGEAEELPVIETLPNEEAGSDQGAEEQESGENEDEEEG